MIRCEKCKAGGIHSICCPDCHCSALDEIDRLQAENERLQGYKREFERALHYVDRCFQESEENPDPIFPDFLRLGDDKFKAVVKLAHKYRRLAAKS